MSKPDSLRRDLHPSIRHHTFPSHFYAYDMDFIEFNKYKQPVGAFEYKHSGEEYIKINSHQMICLRNTANLLKVPFFIVQYYYLNDKGVILQAESKEEIYEAGYWVLASNQLAREVMGSQQMEHEMSEREFVQLLGKLRGELIEASQYSDVKLGYTGRIDWSE